MNEHTKDRSELEQLERLYSAKSYGERSGWEIIERLAVFALLAAFVMLCWGAAASMLVSPLMGIAGFGLAGVALALALIVGRR